MTLLELSTPEPVVAAPPPTSRRVERRGAHVARGLLLLAVLNGAVILRHNGTATLLVVLFLLLAPGALLLRLLDIRVDPVSRLFYAVAGSLALLSCLVLGVDLLLPALGDPAPLRTGPLLVALDALVVGLGLAVRARGRALPLPRLPDLSRRAIAVAAVVVAPPLLVAAGALRIDAGQGNGLLLGTLISLGLLCVALVFVPRAAALRAAALFSMQASLALSYSLHGAGFYGFDIQQEYGVLVATHEAHRWLPVAGDAYNAMLSITALPTAISELSGLGDATVLKLLYPLLFGLFPVGVLLFARRFVSSRTAFMCAVTVVLQQSLIPQLPSLARQELGFLIYLAFLLVVVERRLRPRVAEALLVLFGACLVVTHYSTNYALLSVLVPAVLLAWVARLVSRGRVPTTAALRPWLVAVLVALTVVWNGPVTHSTGNVVALAQDLSAQGLNILPNRSGGSLVSTWLAGNVTQTVNPQAYYNEVARGWADKAWSKPYPDAATGFSTYTQAPTTIRGLLPPLDQPLGLVTLALRQLINLGMVAGTAFIAWLALRRRLRLDLALIAVGMLGLTALARVSGAFALAYNPERMSIQSSVVLVIGLGLLAERVFRRIHPGSLGSPWLGFVLAPVMALLFLQSSGVGAWVSGGTPPGNLYERGEYHERYYATASDVAAATWLRRETEHKAPVFTDKYGQLLMMSYGGGLAGVFSQLAPASLDQRAYVLASAENIGRGRAHGGVTRYETIFAFPRGYLDRVKAVVYSTGTTEVYR